MKNHIAFKFLAVLLCTMALLGSVLCAAGIIAAEQRNLYSEDLPTLQAEYRQQVLSNAARYVLRVYARSSLSEPVAEALWGMDYTVTELQSGTWFYTITDPEGNVAESTLPEEGLKDLTAYTFSGLSAAFTIQVGEPTVSDSVDADSSYAPALTPTEPDGEGNYGLLYWDEESGTYLHVTLRDEISHGWTVTIYASDKSFSTGFIWQTVGFLWENRYNLVAGLVGFLLIFAVGAVYLCCAAGKRPGSTEIRPGGLNCLPLDLYAGVDLLLIYLATQLLREVLVWRDSSTFLTCTALLLYGFFVCLLFVAYCFACAAQFKQEGGRWWRRSVLGWTVLTGIRFLKNAVTMYIPSLCRWLWKILKQVFRFLLGVIQGIRNGIAGIFGWVGRKVHRALSLLPVTWQWLLTGILMLLLLFLAIVRYNGTLLLVGCAVFLLLVVYGAYAFGILLEAARNMGQGDLNAKVSTDFLVGSFRTFANALGDLANVARIAAQKEMKSERMKTELITNVSHDIKTPLTSIINYVDLLQKPHTPQEEQEYLEVLGRKSQQLKKLIQDLMELSKASTGNITADICRVDAVEAVNQALGEYADKLAASNLTPVVKTPVGPVWMQADGRLTWRVLSNLLSNAVKYALPGTRLYVDLTRQGDKVHLSLKNVSAQELNMDAQELMERFVRGDAARNSEGSGLGLNIAKSLMEVQGGALVLTVDGDLFKATLILPAAGDCQDLAQC